MSEAWGLGRLRPVTLRPAEACVREHEVTERERGESDRERERHFYYFNHRPNKINFFFFSSHEQCTSIDRCAL